MHAERRRASPAGPALLAALAEDAIILASGPDASLLRACPCPGCIGFFLQDSPRRKFCSTVCSTRLRVARHSSRRRQS
ncbi:MAG TPA: CGNR zinc finger domain-containing protein [Acidimicrobiia bacterium]|nr:CGNR zinc finger domain-containing protein [Acidimicrobiia bacterium]